MNKKFGLGKGLGALIPEGDELDNNINRIDINLIKPNENQPRKSFDEAKIMQLAESIRENGLIQPIIVQKKDSTYTIIAGERRFRAAKHIGLKDIPAIVMDLTDRQLLQVSLIENIQREDLNPIEEALAYKKLIDDFKLTQEELSKNIGKSRTAIANCIRLLNLDKGVQLYLIEGIISEGHGRALLGVQDRELQYKLCQKIIDENLNVRETEKLIKNLGKDNRGKVKKENHPYFVDLQDRLQGLFGTKVNFKGKKNKGKIEIEFYSEDDLDRIIELLNL